MSTEPDTVHDALRRRMLQRTAATGELSLPAVPGLLEEYVVLCGNLFALLEHPFAEEELSHLRTILRDQLNAAFAASQRSTIVLRYAAAVGGGVDYRIDGRWASVEDTYTEWLAHRDPPLFGHHPDARVWALAHDGPNPSALRILDIGAGTGRNALPLARRGHRVDATEITPGFAEAIRAAAAEETLDMRVIEADVLVTDASLRDDYDLIVLSEVVPDFRSTDQLRGLFEVAERALAPEGRVVLNTFVAGQDYTPSAAARELGQQTYSCIFTRQELADATAGLPLRLIADDSVREYERANLPAEAWPPTGWYEKWIDGRDLFDLDQASCPIDLRWLVYEKTSS